MFINIHIFSKNYNSIEHFSNFFSNEKFQKKLKINISSIKYQKISKTKIFTTLKSPHVNKTAQEHFEYKLYSKQLKIKSYNVLLFVTVLKYIKLNAFADLAIRIEIVNQSQKFLQQVKNELNIDNFSLTQDNGCLNNYLKIFNTYGKIILQLKNNSLDSSVG